MAPSVVLDTYVLVAGLRSPFGASFRLLELLGDGRLALQLSVPLVLEYEAVLKRQARELGLTHADLDAVLDQLCAIGTPRVIFYLWRPVLRDPKDDMVLELAVEAGVDALVTHNVRDFAEAAQFDVAVRTPREFLREWKLL